MELVEATFLFPSFFLAISVLWLLVFMLRNIEQDRINASGGLDDLDGLRWNGWTQALGWPPVTCWQGCADLHRDDWWRVYLRQTCWQGCADLHRDDWWRSYVEHADGSDLGAERVP